MRTTVEEQSLFEMLQYAKISCLPEKNNENKIWAKAIVKIVRNTGLCDYAIAEHDFFSWKEVAVKKEVGGVGIARDIIDIYPYQYLSDTFIPNVSTKKEIIDFVYSRVPEDREYLESITNDALKNMLYNACIKEQIKRIDLNRSYSDYCIVAHKPEPPKVKQEEKVENNEDNKHECATTVGDAAGTDQSRTESGNTEGISNESERSETIVEKKARGRKAKNK